MNKILKPIFFLIILGLFIGSIVSFKSTNPIGEKIIGFSVLIGAFIFLPLFYIMHIRIKILMITHSKKKKMTIYRKK